MTSARIPDYPLVALWFSPATHRILVDAQAYIPVMPLKNCSKTQRQEALDALALLLHEPASSPEHPLMLEKEPGLAALRLAVYAMEGRDDHGIGLDPRARASTKHPLGNPTLATALDKLQAHLDRQGNSSYQVAPARKQALDELKCQLQGLGGIYRPAQSTTPGFARHQQPTQLSGWKR